MQLRMQFLLHGIIYIKWEGGIVTMCCYHTGRLMVCVEHLISTRTKNEDP